MEIDIKIYLANLRKFFTTNEEGAHLLAAPGIDIEEFLKEVQEVAIHNFEENGDPTLDREQVVKVLQILELNLLKMGLETLVDEGKVEMKNENDEKKSTFKLTEEGIKELKESRIFQDTPYGRIYLN